MSVLVAGTVAIDNIKTPTESHENLLGGSASFAAIASRFLSDPTHVVGVIGDDFPGEHLELFKSLDLSTDGLQIIEGGSSFKWHGEYFDNMNRRETLDTHLGVIETFMPQFPLEVAKSNVVLLANMSPRNQLDTLTLCQDPGFVIADTMDLWINIAREELEELLGKIDLLIINDSEAQQLADTHNNIIAGDRLLALGPPHVIVKKGEHGALLFSKQGDFFTAGAYPIRDLHDPTGAGDSFAGGIAGYLAKQNKSKADITFDDIAHAILHGTVLASFTCESFSTHRLAALSPEEFTSRLTSLKSHAKIA
ncbi:MAG: PfkB family carbohydrate kinase [Verrucomicrobiota bacterium]